MIRCLGQQAIAIGLLLGLGLGALGGCMVPVELFSPAMQTVAQCTPQAWAISGLSEVIRHSGSLADILPQLGVLVAFAVVLTSHPLKQPKSTPGHARAHAGAPHAVIAPVARFGSACITRDRPTPRVPNGGSECVKHTERS